MKDNHMYSIFLFLISMVFSIYSAVVYEHPIVVLIPSYNNVSVCKKNLESVFAQTHKNYRIIYIDDASDDGMYEEVCAYITEQNQWDRVTLIRNEVRRGSPYNQFMAIHTCENYEIIVILDGDDALTPDALAVINAAYQDDQILMTYGQYKEDPSGKKGHCKQIPAAIKTKRAYRYYDWVSSHPRTFFAGLFKQIPLGYLLYEGAFQPSAIDLATMFSMLELSNGRVQFIDQVIYLYNSANPNNLFRKDLLRQLSMNYITRGRKPLEPLDFDPRDVRCGDCSDARVGMVILSENNAEGLASCLQKLEISGTTYDGICVVYRASDYESRLAYLDVFERYPYVSMQCAAFEAGLKDALLLVCQNDSYSHIVLMSDTTDMKGAYNMSECVRLLEKTHACGFYFNVAHKCSSLVASEVAPSVELEPNVYAWQFKHANGKWRFAYTADGVLYRAQDILEALESCVFNTCTELCYALHFLKAPGLEDVGLCFGQCHRT